MRKFSTQEKGKIWASAALIGVTAIAIGSLASKGEESPAPVSTIPETILSPEDLSFTIQMGLATNIQDLYNRFPDNRQQSESNLGTEQRLEFNDNTDETLWFSTRLADPADISSTNMVSIGQQNNSGTQRLTFEQNDSGTWDLACQQSGPETSVEVRSGNVYRNGERLTNKSADAVLSRAAYLDEKAIGVTFAAINVAGDITDVPQHALPENNLCDTLTQY